jgi:integrase
VKAIENIRKAGTDQTDSFSAAALESSTTTLKTSTANNHRAAAYQRVYDKRKHAIRSLWIRNGRYYAQLSVEDTNGKKSVRRVPLTDKDGAAVQTVADAVAALNRLKTERIDGHLPVLRRTPTFAEYAQQYLDHYKALPDAHRPSTCAKEASIIDLWTKEIGHVRLNHINKAMIGAHIRARQEAGMKGRTCNLDVLTLRNVLKKAQDDGWIKTLPTDNLRPLKSTPPKRELITQAQLHAICEAALRVSKNGLEFTDYILLMAYCGSRRDETLRLKWADVNFEAKQITIGSDGLAKNRLSRRVDFNARLEEHLLNMKTRRAPDSVWLFPSPQRGSKDQHTKTFKESLKMATKEANVPHFGFHDCRHFFISTAVMAGIDYMTIASWVGHLDGGVLIGKVYGHLASDHTKKQAQRLNFE